MTNALPETISRFIAVVNDGGTDEFLDFFRPDGSVNDWGREFKGRQAIRNWSDREFIGSQGHLEVVRVEQAAGETLVTGDWRSKHANGLSLFGFTLDDDDKIVLMRITEG